MRNFLLSAGFILVFCWTSLSVSAQAESVSYRHYKGVVKDNENKPAAKIMVCGWLNDGRPINGRIPCVTTQKDGSFSISIQKWEGESYHIFVQETENGLLMPDWGNEPSTDVAATDESKLLELRLGPKAGRVVLKIADDESGKPVESGMWKMCRTDQPAICQSMSRAFPQGVIEILMPDSAVTLEIEIPNGNEWEKRFVFNETGNLIETIQVEPGRKKEINVRLKK